MHYLQSQVLRSFRYDRIQVANIQTQSVALLKKTFSEGLQLSISFPARKVFRLTLTLYTCSRHVYSRLSLCNIFDDVSIEKLVCASFLLRCSHRQVLSPKYPFQQSSTKTIIVEGIKCRLYKSVKQNFLSTYMFLPLRNSYRYIKTASYLPRATTLCYRDSEILNNALLVSFYVCF